MNKILSISLLFLTFQFQLTGQKVVPTPDDLYSDAVEFMYSGDYADALPILVNLRDNGNETANVNYLIGECYLNIQGQKTRSIPFLKDAVRNISRNYSGSALQEQYAPVKSLLYLGIAYRLNNNFDNAIISFNNYLQRLDDVDRENRRLAEYHIERCNYARELMASPARFKSDTLTEKINTTVSNFNALVTSDEKVLYYMDKLKFYDAIMRTEKSDNNWLPPENLNPLIKSDGDHYLTGMSANGNQLFFTYYDPYNSGEIYTSEYKEGVWSELHKLNSNINTLFNETHASLSPDGNLLYFTSDRKGGYGGTDIYRSAKNEKGEWDKPVNLGPLINSSYNEESPFVSPDGSRLFFSSQGHYNMGGFDIFYASKGTDGNWLPPVNIGYPLNTTDDDLFFFPIDSGRIAYLSRFSPFSAHKDIIRFDISSFGKPSRFMINGKIDVEGRPEFNAKEIIVTIIDKMVHDTLAFRPLNDDGSFRQSLPAGTYEVDFNHNNNNLLEKTLSIPEYLPHSNLVLHEKVEIPDMLVLKDTLKLGVIRFGFNQNNIDDNYYSLLDVIAGIMMKYPDVRIQVNGYADALGSSQYNLRLSMLRANSVKEYLDRKIGSSDRITVDAFGENNPVALNRNSNGADNPEGRRFNRRAEIVILNAPQSLIIIKVNDIPVTVMQK